MEGSTKVNVSNDYDDDDDDDDDDDNKRERESEEPILHFRTKIITPMASSKTNLKRIVLLLLLCFFPIVVG